MNESIYEAPERIDSSNAATINTEVMNAVEEALSNDADSFVVDMSGCGYISSAGLRVMTMAYKRMRSKGKSFALRNVKDTIRDVFDVTGLSGYLPME